MMRWVWYEGRLSWAVVGVVVFVSASVLSLDVIWRLVKIQFDTLLIYAAFVEAAVAATAVIVIRSARRGSARAESGHRDDR